MIEVAPSAYRTVLLLEEAKLYCFSLNIDGKVGWRLPTWEEYNDSTVFPAMSWNQSDTLDNSRGRALVVPVRDLKDD